MTLMNSKAKAALLAVLAIAALGAAGLLAGEKQGYLGVAIQKLDKESKAKYGVSHGVLVLQVSENSPAEESGLKEDDVILFFNGEKIRTTNDLTEAVRNTEPETEVTVTIQRDGKQKDVRVTVGKMKRSRTLAWGLGNNNMFITRGTGCSYLGVHIQKMNDDLAGYFGVKADQGLLVVDVEKKSPAEAAGIKAGDVITQVDGEKAEEVEDMFDILEGFEAGEVVEVAVIRQKKPQTFKVELKEREHSRTIQIFENGHGAAFEGIDGLRHFPHFFSTGNPVFIDEDATKSFQEQIGDRLEETLKEYEGDLKEKIHKKMKKNARRNRDKEMDKALIKERLERIRETAMI